MSLRNIAFDQFLDVLGQVDLAPVAAAFALMMIVYLIRTIRWQAIIRTERDISLWQTFSILMIGFLGNNILPARAGEIIRAFMLRKQIRVTKSFALGTILVERTNDVAALLTLLLVAIYRFHDILPPVAMVVGRLGLIVLFLFIVGMASLVWARGLILSLMRRTLRLVLSGQWVERLANALEQFAQGLQVLRRPRALAVVVSLSILDWMAISAACYFVFIAFRFSLPPLSAAMTMSLVNLGMIVPSSPGYVGTYEFFTLKSLSIFGITAASALAFSVVMRMLWYLFEIVVGFLCLLSSGIGIGQLFHVTQMDEAAADSSHRSP